MNNEHDDLEQLREPMRLGEVSLHEDDQGEEEPPAADDDDEGDDELEEAELREYGGQALDAPWVPVPLSLARQFLKAVPDAAIDLIFPEAYAEDRSAKLKDLLLAEASGIFSAHRVADQAAQEFGFENFDFDTEQQAIRDERKKYPELGAGDAAAARAIGKPGSISIGAPASGLAAEDAEDDLFNEPRRADLRSPDRARFRRQQREVRTTIVERGPDGYISRLVETPGLVESPAPAVPAGVDVEAIIREKRERLVAKRAAAAAEAEAAKFDDIGFRRQAILEGRQLAARLKRRRPELFAVRVREEQSVEKISKVVANYRFAEGPTQIGTFGRLVQACSLCVFFIKPTSCERVAGKIRPEDLCDLFSPKRRPA